MSLLTGLLDLVAPARCAACDIPGAVLCQTCRDALVFTDSGRACPRCGASDQAVACVECAGRDLAFGSAMAVGPLVQPLSRLVSTYKDSGERRIAPVLGELLAARALAWRDWPGAVVPVPATSAARARRGFDHIAPLARAVALAVRAPVYPCLSAQRRRDQRVLGRDARFANMAGAFVMTGDAPPPARVLLVDDVMTTGATLDSAARVLLAAGALEVRVLVAARAE